MKLIIASNNQGKIREYKDIFEPFGFLVLSQAEADINLEVAETGEITGFKMRIENSKLSTVKALQSIGYDTIAAGDSYNDLDMIRASRTGFLFRSTPKIIEDNPDLQAFEGYDEFLAAIKEELKK